MTILFLSVFLCLYLIKDTEVSLSAGVGTAILTLAALTALAFARKLRHEKLTKQIDLYSENYLRSCINEALYKDADSDELLDYSVGTIILKKVVNTEDTTGRSSPKRTVRPAEPISFRTRNTAVRSADTVSTRITPNGSC